MRKVAQLGAGEGFENEVAGPRNVGIVQFNGMGFGKSYILYVPGKEIDICPRQNSSELFSLTLDQDATDRHE